MIATISDEFYPSLLDMELAAKVLSRGIINKSMRPISSDNNEYWLKLYLDSYLVNLTRYRKDTFDQIIKEIDSTDVIGQ